MSLKCRTGNQQSDDQFQKIMQVCRQRFLNYGRSNGRDYNNGRETDSQESMDSDSDEDVFNNKFLTSAGTNSYNKNDKMGMSGSRYDYSGSSPSSSSSSSRNVMRHSSSHNSSNRSYMSNNNMNDSKSIYNNGHNGKNNRRNMRNGGMDSHGYDDNNYSNRYNMNNNNDNYGKHNSNGNSNGNNNNDGERDQNRAYEQHIVKILLRHLSETLTNNSVIVVDQRGFPERSAVISVMTQNIQDSELQDFIEESVVECYHYLNNNARQEKCQFSQNLLSCLVEKGNEKCEDWNDD